jgi:hypothetical protein
MNRAKKNSLRSTVKSASKSPTMGKVKAGVKHSDYKKMKNKK